MVFAPDDVGDLHAGVVDHHREVVGEAAVGALDDEVADDVADEKVMGPWMRSSKVTSPVGHPEADGGLLARGKPACHLVRRECGSSSGRTWASARAASCSSLQLVEQLLGAEAAIGRAVGEQLLTPAS